MPDGLLFILATGGAAQNVGLLAPRNGYLFHFHVRLHPRPVILQQLLFKVLHLAACCPDQVLTPAFADGRQVLFANHAAIHYPDPGVPCHTGAPPCAAWFPWWKRRRDCR